MRHGTPFPADHSPAPRKRPLPGRDTAPSGEPVSAGGEESRARDARRTRYLLRFIRGSGHAPELRGLYLRWQAGFLRPCATQAEAGLYDLPHAARDVATRAESVFRGARVAVVPVLA